MILANLNDPWYLVVIQVLALFGILGFIFSTLFEMARRLLGFLFRPVTHFTATRYEINLEHHRDPTRPNFMEDENAAWVNVTRKMQQIEKRAKGGQ